jgi:hypothetical protein
LFADAGDLRLDFGELAHIVAASDKGPRADLLLGAFRRAEVDNIVLLCANCHTQVDKAPTFYAVEMLQEWQRHRMVELEGLFGAIKFATRLEAADAVRVLLGQNRAVFDAYGPRQAALRGHHGEEFSRQWHRKVRELILPNNRRLLALCDRNQDLLVGDEPSVVELLRQHVDDLEARHFRSEVEPGSLQFPSDIQNVFRDG